MQQDWQGSVRTVSNQNGYVISRTDHSAYGETIGAGVGLRSTLQGYFDSPDTRQGYGLTERDEATGLDHTWFRKNEGQAGRWTSPDPYLGSMEIGNPQSFNRYSYVSGDPINFVDPSGLFQTCWVASWWECTSVVVTEEERGAGILSSGDFCDKSSSTSSTATRTSGNCELNVGWICRNLNAVGGYGYYLTNPNTGLGGGGFGGILPDPPKPRTGKPTVQQPPKIPIGKQDPSNPPMPKDTVGKIKFVTAIILRILGRFLTPPVIMVNPQTVCEEARREGAPLDRCLMLAPPLIESL